MVDRCVEPPEAKRTDHRPAEDAVLDGQHGLGAELASKLVVCSSTDAFAVPWTHVDEILHRLEISGRCLACALYLDTRDRSALYRCVAVSPSAEELRLYPVDGATYLANRAVLLPREGVYPAVDLRPPLSLVAPGPAERCWVKRYPAQRGSGDRPLMFAIATLAPESIARGGPGMEPDATLGDIFAEIFAVVAARAAAVERSWRLRELGDIHAILAHDLPAKFRIMDFGLDLLESDKQGSDHGRQELARRIAQADLELQNAVHYIWRMRMQIENDYVRFAPEAIDPRELIGRVLDRPGVHLEIADGSGDDRELMDCVLQADERCLSLALANVLNNALGSGNEVLVQVRLTASEAGAPTSSKLTIQFGDHGRGIPDDCRDADDRSLCGDRRAAGRAGLGFHVDGPVATDPSMRTTIELPLSRRT
jgi:signal transduction histidine kinase